MLHKEDFDGCNWCGEHEEEYTYVNGVKVCTPCKMHQEWHLEAIEMAEGEIELEFGKETMDRYRNTEKEYQSGDKLIEYEKQLEDLLVMLELFELDRHEAEDYVAAQEMRITKAVRTAETMNQLKWAFRMIEIFWANFGTNLSLVEAYIKRKTQLTGQKAGFGKQKPTVLTEPMANAFNHLTIA